MIYIYALVDPRTEQVRYIGKSVRPKERLQNQCNEHTTTHRSHWLQSLLAVGLRPVQRTLEIFDDDMNWQDAEKAWIAMGRALGWPLTNGTAGGDGVEGLDAASRARITHAWVGRKHRPESLVLIGRASLGRRHTEAYKTMMREKMAVRVFTVQHRERLARANAKLTDAQAAEIKTLLTAHVSQYAIASQFGVHQGTISNIKRGLCYAHVPWPALVSIASTAEAARHQPTLFDGLEPLPASAGGQSEGAAR